MLVQSAAIYLSTIYDLLLKIRGKEQNESVLD